MYIHELVY